jgi:hypothetical protein
VPHTQLSGHQERSLIGTCHGNSRRKRCIESPSFPRRCPLPDDQIRPNANCRDCMVSCAALDRGIARLTACSSKRLRVSSMPCHRRSGVTQFTLCWINPRNPGRGVRRSMGSQSQPRFRCCVAANCLSGLHLSAAAPESGLGGARELRWMTPPRPGSLTPSQTTGAMSRLLQSSA